MKRLFWTILAAAALASLFIAGTRFTLEEGNRQVQLVYDLRAVKEQSESLGKSVPALLGDLQREGIQSVGIEPFSLGEWLLTGKPLREEIREKIPPEPRFLKDYLHYPVAFDLLDFELVTNAGLLAVPKISTVPWPMDALWLNYNPRLVIVSGLGELKKEQLYETQARLGLVEFSVPKIEGGQASQMVRLHGISAAEMEVLSRERILNRYLRAVKERNIRVLYLRPATDESWAESLQMVSKLQERLLEHGFTLGEAKPFSPWNVPFALTILVWAGIWAGTVLFAVALFPRLLKIFSLAGIVGLSATIILSFYQFHLAQKALALLAAIIFPCLALQVTGGKTPWRRYLMISGLSLVGALLVVGTLAGSEYLVKLHEFRGVKVMHIVPVLLVFFSVVRPLKSWLNKNVPVKHLAIAGAIGLLGLFYLKRTGNFGLPVLQWEITFREFLEKTLLVRPRTKEFLLGHPALYLFVHREDDKRSWWAPLAVVGQLSLINTFTHIYTPLKLSLLRTIYGLALGYLIGWIISRCFLWGKRWLQGDFGLRLLRFWQSR